MKTTKFVLIAAILSFALMSFTTNEPVSLSADPGTLANKMALRTAMQNFDLVKAMHEQIDQSFLQVDQPGPYVARVKYKRVTYAIYGSLDEWKRFFSVAIGNNDPPIR